MTFSDYENNKPFCTAYNQKVAQTEICDLLDLLIVEEKFVYILVIKIHKMLLFATKCDRNFNISK